MLFNSYIFIFAFLPISLIVFYSISRGKGGELALAWLTLCSIVFYAWWNPIYLVLIFVSIAGNYGVGRALAKSERSTILLVFGVVFNLLLLGYFKYANFFVDSLNAAVETSFTLEKIILPLAISFFTFQQIAYLVDCYKKGCCEKNLLHYSLFVMFFPQLIAGPIVHHHEMFKQFKMPSFGKFNLGNLGAGFTLFAIGLFKKTVIADSLGTVVDPVFESAADNMILTSADIWYAVWAYSLQIYFDFSAYSDMAIGLGKMFGVNLPINFFSPYKARNFFEFWSRWHASLSRFMRLHLYMPLSRANLLYMGVMSALVVNMLIGGIWHGASWTFLLWGLAHAVFLTGNHVWHKLRRKLRWSPSSDGWGMIAAGVGLTFFLGMFTRVFYRSAHYGDLLTLLDKMFEWQTMNHFSAISHHWLQTVLILGLMLIVWFAPNSHEIMRNYKMGLPIMRMKLTPCLAWLSFSMSIPWGIVVGIGFVVSVVLISRSTAFIYFSF